MASADSLAIRQLADVRASPGKSIFLPSIPVASTYLPFRILSGFTMMCLLTQTNMPHMRRTGDTKKNASPSCSSVQTFAVWLSRLHRDRLFTAYLTVHQLATC